jgi:hypothetical protein
MLTRPDGLSDEALVSAISAGWNFTVASISYCAVGFGSHHWDVVDARGDRRFATVDDLVSKRCALDEGDDTAFAGLRAALATVQDLRDAGCDFVVAPMATTALEPLLRIDRRYAVALYPHVDGKSFAWGEFSTPAHRQAVLDMVVALHGVPTTATPRAPTDDFGIPHRDELELTIHRADTVADSGPYAARTRTLVTDHASNIRRLLERYDDLVQETRDQSLPTVLTHGEPHAGNTLLTAAGWKLIDWDTLLVAPPARDLWSLDPGDGSIIDAYTRATGTTPLPSTLDLYRLRWDLAEIAAFVSRFRGPHTDSADDEKSWVELRDIVTGLDP